MIDWTDIYKEYKGKWVAIKSDNKTVVASGKTLAEVVMSAKKAGYQKPGLFYVPKKEGFFIGTNENI